jgi:HlyD family secretion protein
VSCDGCGENILAKLSFISEQAEYTPPVIFSTEERAKLVFRVEARISSGRTLPIGLPVGVRPQFKMMEAAP